MRDALGMPLLRGLGRPSCCAAVSVALVGVFLQDPQPSAAAGVRQPDAEVLQHALELARPTSEHERLGRLVGSWRVQMTTFGAEGAPHQAAGKMVCRAILGGRYVVLNFDLELAERRLEAVQILGFDTMLQSYTASWRDSGSTWSIECRGVPGDEAEVLQLRGSLVDARSPRGRPFRLTLDLSDRARVPVTIHEGVPASEVLVQQQVWTRT